MNNAILFVKFHLNCIFIVFAHTKYTHIGAQVDGVSETPMHHHHHCPDVLTLYTAGYVQSACF